MPSRSVRPSSRRAQARQQLAHHLLGSRYQHQLRGLHGWLRLPAGVSPDELAGRAEQAGVLISSARYFAPDGQHSPAAVRLGLMATESREQLSRALTCCAIYWQPTMMQWVSLALPKS